MQCKECGEFAREHTLRYCENCGAKMPPPPPPGSIRRTGARPAIQTSGRARGTGTARALPAPDEAEDTDPGLRPVRADDADEHTDPGRPAALPYDGPVWLTHVPGHSPSVVGVGLLAMALVLSLLFSGAGPFWSLVTFAGGWLVTARELRMAGEKHPLVDWVPESLLRPLVPAVYAVVVAGLALRMLGIGFTPMLWLGGAALLVSDQYRKVFAGEDGWSRLFEPRRLLRGMGPVALGGVALCLTALFLTWLPGQAPKSGGSAGPVPRGPPELQVVDAPRPSDDVVYSLFEESYDKGWDQPFSVAVEMMLLAMLGLMALRPEVPRPEWLRFSPIGVVVLGLVWTLVQGGLLLGPLLFLAGLAAAGFASVYTAFSREA
jgi:hypothetical protein